MRGLIVKSIYETWLTTLLFAIGLGCALALLTSVLPQLQEGIGDILASLPFVRTVIQALFGTEIGDELTLQMMQAILWVHPVVLSLVWAHEIVLCTRIPVSEIDRGTIDVLLGLPVSRRTIYVADSVVWLVSGGLVLLGGLIGHASVASQLADMRSPLPRVFLVLFNLYCVYLAVGGVARLVSASSNRRGRAIGLIFSLVLASFLLNFLAQFWPPAQQVAFLSVMKYYQPTEILRSGQLPLSDMTVLLGVSAATWLAGNEIFARRSICTV